MSMRWRTRAANGIRRAPDTLPPCSARSRPASKRPIRVSIPSQPSTESDRMSTRINRREFVQATAAAAGLSAASEAFGQAPAVATPGVKPLVIASANGNRYKNGGGKACLETAFERGHPGPRRARRRHRRRERWTISIPATRASATAACRTPMASSSSMPPACTVRSGAPARWPVSKASARRPRSRGP